MFELWGFDSCIACKQAADLLSKTPLEWRYVDVIKTKFTGMCPRLVLEDGTHIEGLGPINSFVKQKLKEMGL